GQEIIDRQSRVKHELAEHRIRAVDRLDLDQCEPAIAGARHPAQRRRNGYFAARAQEGNLFRLGLALEQHEGGIAAEQCAALARQSLAQARGDRADACDRHHAKGDTGDEYVEAAQAAAQFAQRIAQRERRRAALADSLGYDAHEAALRCVVSPSIRPERKRTTRSQRCASVVSWVTNTSVMPRSSCLENRRSTICFPVASSRFPVGSSATRIAGSGARARARATRCCSPPDNCVG